MFSLLLGESLTLAWRNCDLFLPYLSAAVSLASLHSHSVLSRFCNTLYPFITDL